MPKPGKKRNSTANYDIVEHVHRFASWAASRAASRGQAGLTTERAMKIIEGAGLRAFLAEPCKLPKSAKKMDAIHRNWRDKAIRAANEPFEPGNGETLSPIKLSHGRAAKLINVYFKAGLVTTAHKDHAKIGALHPPIDRDLLQQLAIEYPDTAPSWRTLLGHGWTSFDSDQYQAVINNVRKTLGNKQRLWMIEKHWPALTP
jgi:hypothetical protein